MEWLIEKKGYLVLIGILCMSPVVALAISSLFYRGWRFLNMLDESYMITAFIIHIIISIAGFTFSIYELKKRQMTNMTHKIIGLVSSSSMIIFYLTILLLIVQILH